MTASLHDKLKIAKAVGVEVILLHDTPDGYMYKEFDADAANKYVIDPHNMTGKA